MHAFQTEQQVYVPLFAVKQQPCYSSCGRQCHAELSACDSCCCCCHTPASHASVFVGKPGQQVCCCRSSLICSVDLQQLRWQCRCNTGRVCWLAHCLSWGVAHSTAAGMVSMAQQKGSPGADHFDLSQVWVRWIAATAGQALHPAAPIATTQCLLQLRAVALHRALHRLSSVSLHPRFF